MKLWSKIRKYNRSLHRSIGFLVFGITVIYSISGFLLNHIGGHGGTDPAFKTTTSEISLVSNFTGSQLLEAWNQHYDLPKAKRTSEIDSNHLRLFLDGGIGIYEKSTGSLEYKYHKRKHLVYYINKLHYNKIRGWSLPADLFAFSLLFLAVSGLFMVKGKNGITGSGLWWLLAGIVVPILYIIFM